MGATPQALSESAINFIANLTSSHPRTDLNISQVVASAIQSAEFDYPVSGEGPFHDGAAKNGLPEGCFNATLFEQYIRLVVKNVTTLTKAQRREIEGDPLFYIIAVLIFYSCGIVVLMINYMKKEQSDFEETNLYKQYIDKRDRCDEFNNRGRSLNRLALQALNAVNVISQQDGDNASSTKIAFV
ncbi:hypothetical protein TCAL_03559 [Tigriopus californicus]|uniref:Uncharacterized protein n=1 Tax=Tigriopus californicus TaxID=6832 RepID=A0A553NDA2_TIGCA|nr:uncharacterized protein LOC131888325 [Tigriopus californicus]TRY63388.1 hypothetical protein TCAL_03559 [Tigriopus californicus]